MLLVLPIDFQGGGYTLELLPGGSIGSGSLLFGSLLLEIAHDACVNVAERKGWVSKVPAHVLY